MLIHSGRDMEFFLNSGDTDYLLVMFGEIAYLANGTNYWGKPTIERRRVNAIGIAARTPNWFPRADLDAFVTKHRALLDRFRGRIVLAGHSMGGYGAIKYSGLFGASAVVATVPQYTLDRSILPNDKRPRIPYFNPELHKDMQPTPQELSGDIFIFCDMQHSGRPQFDAYAAMNLPRIRIFNVPSFGHEVANVFAKNDGFIDLVDLCRAGDEAEIRRFVRERRRHLPLRGITLALRAANRRPDLAMRLYRRHEDRFPPIYMAMLAKAIAETRPAGSDELMREALARKPDVAAYPAVSNFLASKGRAGEAQSLVDIIPPV